MAAADARRRSRWDRVAIVGLVALVGVAGVLLNGAQPATAASFTVNSTLDRANTIPGDGLCEARISQSAPPVCTPRAAIQEANAHPGADIIALPAGVYDLEIPVPNDDLPETGDFDIMSPITIDGVGPGADGTVHTIIASGFPIDGSDPLARGMDRLFEIHPAAGNVTFTDPTLREAASPADGGAIGRIFYGELPSVPSTVVSAVFVFAADQAGATYECALDGLPFTMCTSPVT